MPRPRCCRKVTGRPVCRVFRPVGVPAAQLPEVALSLDEFEAVRLADLEGLYQEDAAARMGVSRQTFGRILAEARRKVAAALVGGLALRLLGDPALHVRCDGCARVFELAVGTERPEACPHCRRGLTGDAAPEPEAP